MNVVIRNIPHAMQRYPTVGDWTISGDTLDIRVSILGNWRYEFLVAIHEAIEAILCKHRGITDEAVTAFDKEYEESRKVNNEIASALEETTDDDSEPGDDPKAPYRKEHFFATNIERMMAAELGVDWKKYEDTLYALP